MKRALLVGIKDYPLRPLRGCVNDVDTAAAYLVEQRGFVPGDIRRLVDAQATAQAIRDGLAWLVGGARPGDSLYCHYSGHGTLFPITGADGKVSEVHGAICPVDFDWTHGRPLLDSELRTIIDRVPDGTEFVFVSDSCHSGELTRVTRWGRARTLPPPPAVARRLAEAQAAGIAPQLLTAHDRCALIAGCRADQTSEDDFFETDFNGALTYHLFRTLRAGTWGTTPLPALIREVTARLRADAYAQEPQVRGPDALLGRAFLTG